MIRLESQTLNELTEFRRALHSHPEISGEESETAKRVISFLQGFGPDRIIKNIGGHGLLAEFRGRSKGPTVMFRCELDALPLEENNKIPYRSAYPGK
ncbi:MAG TPA: hypothetical protein VK994_06885, partial [Bacteroidales bacterium]|nr:hypothetical protein [Bacteroidales bacterium]